MYFMRDDSFIQAMSNECPIELNLTTWSQVSYCQSNYKKELFPQHAIDFPSDLTGAVEKRCSEYLAGRLAAQQAVLNLTKQHHPILRNKDQTPLWPTGVIGSITHTNKHAIAVATLAKHHQIIGVDSENWIEPDIAKEVASTIISFQESQLINESSLEFNQGLTIIFSAKESLYKALYPSVGSFFGFECAQVNCIDIKSGDFSISLQRDLNKTYRKGWTIQGKFHNAGESTLTFISTPCERR
ncbi:hypothetical protein B6A42_26890 (plasmid) [Vibrio coralliilyticus]|nr:hypothetical protein B6A42_26890 [Vibrio coralliilyticus]